MRLVISLIVLCFAFSAFAYSKRFPYALDPEMTGKEYLNLLEKNYDYSKEEKSLSEEDAELEKILAVGKRNLEWVDFVNNTREPSQRLSLSSPATQQGSPVSSPRVYNFRIIQDKWKIALTLLPSSLMAVLINGAPLTSQLEVSDREFIERLFEIDSVYQLAARYRMLNKWRESYAEYAIYDVRGYLNLLDETGLDQQLDHWNSLSIKKQARLTRDLVLICLNSKIEKSICLQQFHNAIEGQAVRAFKDQYMVSSKELYNSFFEINRPRVDVLWDEDKNIMSVPFSNPHNENVLNFLKENVEDEWRINDWHLQLNFIESDSVNTSHIVFEPGATPNVSNGNVITMDENTPLSEYGVQWTIRHEYGHILGFPDCYFEFYDEELEAFVSYQLDVTNLMCSRRGKLQQTHFDELKKNYYK